MVVVEFSMAILTILKIVNTSVNTKDNIFNVDDHVDT